MDTKCRKGNIPVSSQCVYLISSTLALMIRDRSKCTIHLIIVVPLTNSVWLVKRKLHQRELRQFVEGLVEGQ